MVRTNSNNYIEIDGTYYVLDMDALSRYIVGDDDEKVTERTKTEQWVADDKANQKGGKGNDMFLYTKEITESSSARKDEHAPFRAEVAKMMLSLVFYPTVGENGESVPLKRFDTSEMSVGQVLAFNTLIDEGIIKEVEIEDEETQN